LVCGPNTEFAVKGTQPENSGGCTMTTDQKSWQPFAFRAAWVCIQKLRRLCGSAWNPVALPKWVVTFEECSELADSIFRNQAARPHDDQNGHPMVRGTRCIQRCPVFMSEAASGFSKPPVL